MKLNADIGESFGKWTLGNDASIMPLIDEANIACGYHAGDALIMQSTLALAKQHNVTIGAHVSYPDLQGFGRRSMVLSEHELIAITHAQIAVLEGMALTQNMKLNYVKPHGALYNDMMQDINLYESVLKALSRYHCLYKLVIQALPDLSSYIKLADQYKVSLKFEGFADRAYTNDGLLVSRSKNNAVLDEQASLRQVEAMLEGKSFLSENGRSLDFPIDTLCVHSDTPNALELCRKIRQLTSTKSVAKSLT